MRIVMRWKTRMIHSYLVTLDRLAFLEMEFDLICRRDTENMAQSSRILENRRKADCWAPFPMRKVGLKGGCAHVTMSTSRLDAISTITCPYQTGTS